MDSFANIINFPFKLISKHERLILEAELYLSLYKELKNFFRDIYKDYFCLIHYTLEQAEEMIEKDLLKMILNDILSSNEYTLEGIARYTNTPEDMLHEIFLGNYISPSAKILKKAIELHRFIRPTLYKEIIEKIKRI